MHSTGGWNEVLRDGGGSCGGGNVWTIELREYKCVCTSLEVCVQWRRSGGLGAAAHEGTGRHGLVGELLCCGGACRMGPV